MLLQQWLAYKLLDKRARREPSFEKVNFFHNASHVTFVAHCHGRRVQMTAWRMYKLYVAANFLSAQHNCLTVDSKDSKSDYKSDGPTSGDFGCTDKKLSVAVTFCAATAMVSVQLSNKRTRHSALFLLFSHCITSDFLLCTATVGVYK